MAVIQVQFDVDSDIHPELHALLAAVTGSAARGERFRHLAASGLAWERQRMADPAHADALAGEAFAQELRSAAARLPVLTEVIDPTQLPLARRASPARRKAPARVAEVLAVETPAGAGAPDEPAAPGGPADLPAPRSLSRSRVLRMKDMGLFRNE